MQPLVFLGIKEVFPESSSSDESFKEILGRLPRAEVLPWCAHVNILLTGIDAERDPRKRQNLVFRQYVNFSDLAKISHAGDKFGGVNTARVFHRGQMLELIRWLSQHGTDDIASWTTMSLHERKHLFLMACLHASHQYSLRVFPRTDSASIHPASRRLANQESGALKQHLHEIPRGAKLLLQYMPTVRPSFEREFESLTGFSLGDFYTCFLTIQRSIFVGNKDGFKFPRDQVCAESSINELFSRFMDRYSQDISELALRAWKAHPREGYKKLRERPFLTIDNPKKDSFALDTDLFVEKLTLGPLFEIISSAPDGSSGVFGHFGRAFERYVHDSFLRSYAVGPSTSRKLLLDASFIGPDGGEHQVDLMINQTRTVFVFEVKSAFLPDMFLIPANRSRFMEEMWARYGNERDEVTGGRIKGVAQLARSVHAIASRSIRSLSSGSTHHSTHDTRENHDFSKTFRNMVRIVPVLLSHDNKLDAHGFPSLFADRFAGFMSKLALPKDSPAISPLILMTIDDLEALEASKGLNLERALKAYDKEDPGRGDSFWNFIATSVFSDSVRINSFVLEDGMKRHRDAVFESISALKAKASSESSSDHQNDDSIVASGFGYR